MLTLKEYNTKLANLRNTRKMTHTMKMVAVTRLRKAQEAYRRAEAFGREFTPLLANVLAANTSREHPLLTPRPAVSASAVLLATADRGLCGGFNHNLCKLLDHWLREDASGRKCAGILHRGRRGQLHFKNRIPILRGCEEDAGAPSDEAAQRLGEILIRMFLDGKADEIYLAYNKSLGAGSHAPTIERLLPIEVDATAEPAPSGDFLLEPSPMDVLDILLRQFVTYRMHLIQTASVVGEQAARMMCMERATTNVDELIESCTILRNQARQAAITSELIEIVAGAEALTA